MILPALETSLLDEWPCHGYVHVAPVVHGQADLEDFLQDLFLTVDQLSPNPVDSFNEKLPPFTDVLAVATVWLDVRGNHDVPRGHACLGFQPKAFHTASSM